MLQYFIIINLHKICQTVYVIPKSLQKVLRKEFYVKRKIDFYFSPNFYQFNLCKRFHVKSFT
uniref:ORF27 n=1 Tax=Cnaphalocrocis medinalis granulovirus TaxID=1750712 RepID=A0A0X9FQ36_9BBAC|nr:ORF27 [Cnaphalocrocis medinalis granulovirus]